MDRTVALSVGDTVHLKRGKDRIAYAGMPSDGVFSIVQRKESGYHGFAWNLFFPKGRSEIRVDDVRVYVENVTPDEIRLRIG